MIHFIWYVHHSPCPCRIAGSGSSRFTSSPGTTPSRELSDGRTRNRIVRMYTTNFTHERRTTTKRRVMDRNGIFWSELAPRNKIRVVEYGRRTVVVSRIRWSSLVIFGRGWRIRTPSPPPCNHELQQRRGRTNTIVWWVIQAAAVDDSYTAAAVVVTIVVRHEKTFGADGP
jgi:hypothetical protein